MIKRIQIRAALDALKTIRMAKIEDKALRNAIITTHMRLLDEQDRLDVELRKLETAMLSGFTAAQRAALAERQDAVAVEPDTARRTEMSRAILQEFGDLLAAQRAYNREALRVADAPLDRDLTPIQREAFLSAMDAQAFDFGLLEAVYPLLNAPAAQETNV